MLFRSQTAAELVASQANSTEPHMGLKTWKNSPSGKILKSDVTVGKNYLGEKELKELNRVVTMYLDYAENQAERHVVMKMSDWAEKIDVFLQFNEYDILNNPGKISNTAAEKLAHKEYEIFRLSQDKAYVSDFETEVKKLNIN